MTEAVETIEYKGYNIEIYQDDMPENPRMWDNLGNMVCFHSRYNLGDSHSYTEPHEFLAELSGVDLWGDQAYKMSPEEYVKYCYERIKNVVILPLYLYDHSGITISTSSFSCRWDSGQVGWIYVSYEDIKKEYGWKHITNKRSQQVKERLEGEVETYDQYITGDLYYYSIESDKEFVGSCGGFFGDNHEESGLLEHAKNDIDCHISRKVKSHTTQVKKWIKTGVPEIYRKELEV